MSKGIALVEFHSVDYASHTLAHSASILLEGRPLRVQFAKESFIRSTLTSQQNLAMQNAYAAAALQAAQWAQPLTQTTYPISSHTSNIQPQLPKVKSIWPPCFETQGGSYIFQPNTGLFFEGVTLFYYCPKSKLYYNSNDGCYYKYNSLLTPPFTPFAPPLPNEEQTIVLTPDILAKDVIVDAKDKKPFSLSLGGTVAMKPKVNKHFSVASLQDSDDAIIVNSAPIQHIPGSRKATNDAQRKQIQSEVPGVAVAKEVSASQAKVPAVLVACLLCKRQFASQDQLIRHEKESKLHAENLAKQPSTARSVSKSEGSEASAPVYKDRAAERRATYGESIPILYKNDWDDDRDKRGYAKHLKSSDYPAQRDIEAKVYEDGSNPGNQMLRKMGWTEGDGLGRNGEGTRDPVALDGHTGRDKTGVGSSEPKIYLDYHGDGYKESLLRAAKARYDNLNR